MGLMGTNRRMNVILKGLRGPAKCIRFFCLGVSRFDWVFQQPNISVGLLHYFSPADWFQRSY